MILFTREFQDVLGVTVHVTLTRFPSFQHPLLRLQPAHGPTFLGDHRQQHRGPHVSDGEALERFMADIY